MYIAGDNRAADALVLRYKRQLYSIARAYRLQPEECGDVIQEVWIAFIQNACDLRDHEKLGPWLVKVLKRRCLALLEQKRANLAPERKVEEQLDPNGTLEQMLLSLEERQVLREVLEKWPNPCRTLLMALYFEDATYEDAAALLGISADGIGRQRSRCIDQLRFMLSKRGFTFRRSQK